MSMIESLMVKVAYEVRIDQGIGVQVCGSNVPR